MDFQKYILFPLQEVVTILKNNGYEVEIKSNNHSVVGDTKLVTSINVNKEKKLAKVGFGEFVFNLNIEGN